MNNLPALEMSNTPFKGHLHYPSKNSPLCVVFENCLDQRPMCAAAVCVCVCVSECAASVHGVADWADCAQHPQLLHADGAGRGHVLHAAGLHPAWHLPSAALQEIQGVSSLGDITDIIYM